MSLVKQLCVIMDRAEAAQGLTHNPRDPATDW